LFLTIVGKNLAYYATCCKEYLTQSPSISNAFAGGIKPQKCQIEAVRFYGTGAILPFSTSETACGWTACPTCSNHHGVALSEDRVIQKS